jgi:hypothetical protein
MNPISESGADWKPTPGEIIRECANPWTEDFEFSLKGYDHCGQCSEVPYRVLVLESKDGKRRGVALCGRHFLDACKECSEKTPCRLAEKERIGFHS